MVTAEFAVPYLQAIGLLDAASLVDRGVRFIPASGRTGGLQVEVEDGLSFFLKGAPAENTRKLMRRESEVYLWLWRQFAHVPPFAPKSYGLDERNGILILELRTRTQNLHAAESPRKRSLVHQAGLTGAALARLHRMPWTAGPTGIPKNQLQWLQRAAPAHFDLFENLSDSSRACVEIIQSQPELAGAIAALAADWRADHSIHGDLRWANVLTGPGPRGAVWLIDWEFAGPGDACWDTGCFLAHYLDKWVASLPVSAGTSMETAVELARRPLSGMHAAAGTFWRTYVHHMNLQPPAAREWLERTARFLAARLLKIACETESGPGISIYQVVLIQLAQNIFAQPLPAMAALLALA